MKYSKIGTYSGYDKNNKEREALDYYSTPQEEVTNILDTIKLNLDNQTVLEPCCGGGHMLQGIFDYLNKQNGNCTIFATDIKDRGNIFNLKEIQYGKEYDFLADTYPFVNDIDYIIMNPPYSVLEPFLLKSLEIADKGVLILARLQALEGEKRFEKIFKENPPSDIYCYVDRIACHRNGEIKAKAPSAQAYAWLYWDQEKKVGTPAFHWLRRVDKKEKI